MDKRKDCKICIMVIPHNDKVKRLMIPRWLPKLLSISMLIISLVIIMIFRNVYSSYESLKEEYESKVTEIGTLKEDNENKEKEITNLISEKTELYQKSTEVEDKLAEIDKLQRELEKMAGVQNPSRGSSIINSTKLQSTESVDDLQILNETLNNKEKELIVFINNLEKRFEYLETIPNLWPTKGRLTSKFGNRRDPFGRGTSFHEGIDIANSPGIDIWAAARGKVTYSNYKSGHGRTIIIDHGNGYKTLYAHNSKLLVDVGDMVEKGQVIAKIGNTGRSTGPHLHFEVHKNGMPIDPLTVLK